MTEPLLHVDVITLLPEVVEAYLSASVLGRARESGTFTARTVDLRPFGVGKHRQVDDAPYGGGAGMVLAPGPAVAAIESCGARARTGRYLMAPGGRTLDRDLARELAEQHDHLVLLCGRFEGVDARVGDWLDGAISLGDVVLTGGELAALAVVDATVRLLPGALGNDASARDESFEGPLLEYPQYTRPREFEGRSVPDVLLSGDHGRIAAWRREEALRRTLRDRPDLLEGADLPADLRGMIKELDRRGSEE